MGADLCIQPHYSFLEDARSQSEGPFPIGFNNPFYYRSSCWPTRQMISLGIDAENLESAGFDWSGNLDCEQIGRLVVLFYSAIDKANEVTGSTDLLWDSDIESVGRAAEFLTLAYSLAKSSKEGVYLHVSS